ncbi:hypothetical protein GCM10007036_14190 [Alsobacter metallidurans]|uniref:Uncharacterized protein n=1 Tax=Alsobacter metallidurans TaxID=340221 RepID=A0A917I5K5_9HYPH|nr:hypothetical protein [Alsobacter metallidurans]GGH14681.1 hypothetical protein GCM10007036_14190 [Alsobacter metallidurans]
MPLLLVVRKPYFLEFLRGEKTIEYRRYGPRWCESIWRVGREIGISMTYDGRYGQLPATVTKTEAPPFSAHPEMLDFYEGSKPTDKLFLIHVDIPWERVDLSQFQRLLEPRLAL